MNNTEAIQLILKQLDGTLSPDEALALNAWLAENAEHAALQFNITKLYRADWRSIVPSPSPAFLEKQRKTLHERAAVAHERPQPILIRLAAVFVLALLALLFIYFTNSASDSGRTLTFTHTELERVVETLEDEYHISFRIEDSEVRKLRFHGQFVNADVTDVLAALVSSQPITVEHQPGLYVLTARRN